MTWPTAIQYVDEARNEDEARRWLAWLATQIDYLFGRVLSPGGGAGKTNWRVQVFFDSTGVTPGCLLPDGCRLAVLPPGISQQLPKDYGKESRSIQLD